MNVGGHRVESDRLGQLIGESGFTDVSTFRTSGNVIFDAVEKHDVEEVALLIERRLTEGLGYEVPVFLRSTKEIQAIAAFAPFEEELIESSAGKLQVVLLAKKPSPQARAEVLEFSSDEDRLVIQSRELYWLPSGGILDSELDQKTITAQLGVSTTRTKGTIDLIASKFFS
jgi:uncharacterized protein (DUF1697 family)